MKIAQISNVWFRTPPAKYGSIEAVVSYLTEELVALGHEVTLFATGDSITNANLWSYYPTPVPGPSQSIIAENFKLQNELVHLVKACEYIAQSDFDIVHNHAYIFGPAVLSFLSTPHLTTFSDVPYKNPPASFFEAFSSRNKYVSISHHQRELIPNLNWVGTVYEAIKVTEFPFQIDKEEYLLFIGSIAPWKGPHVAVQVARMLGKHLKIAGPLLDQRYFEQEIAPYVDGKLIEYLGEVDHDQKMTLYKRAAALLFPIDWEESFGLVMIEALACGTPVIAFARGAAPEIIVEGEVGFLVKNADEMGEAVKKLADISPWNCRKHVERLFDARRMAENYLELYQKVISAKKR